MKFEENLTQEEYINFWQQTPNNHFLQSYEWGITNEKTRNLIPKYVGLKDENNKIIAAALLLKKKTPLNMCYYYSPRGFTMDFSNKEILTEFTNKLKEFLRTENAIYLKLDPPIMYQEVDENANKIENGQNNYQIFNNFINLGYKHRGFNKLYERNQPRYTFRTYFNKYESLDEVEKSFSKTFAKILKRSYTYDLEIYEAKEIDTFYKLIELVSEKDGFHAYKKEFYQTVYDNFSKNKHIKIFNAKINPQKIIDKLNETLKKEKNKERKTKIEKDIAYFAKLPNKEEYTCGSLICTYSATGAWSLYIGNDEVATYTGCVNRLYYEFIKDAYENHYEYADLFGVVGDPGTKYKNLAGIFEYKRKIGGDCIEFIGEFDLINKPLMYTLLPVLLKIYRSIRKEK